MKTVIQILNPAGEVKKEIDASGKTAQEISKLKVEVLRNYALGHTTKLVETVGGGEA